MSTDARCSECNHALWDKRWGEFKCKKKLRVCTQSELLMGCDQYEKLGTKPGDPKPEIVVRSGATFYPSVSDDGVISWTNDKGLPNPEPVGLAYGLNGKDGEDGKDGKDGKDGYTPVKGVDYVDGKDGISVTHSWDGTRLIVTSASGTSLADLKGEQGPRGVQGERGERGPAGGEGYTPVKGVDYFDGEKGEKGDKGDTGPRGPQGEKGERGNVGRDGADGYTPVKGKDYFDGKDGYTPVKGVDYYTEAEETEIVNKVLAKISSDTGGSTAKIGEVTLLAASWVGDNNLYSQAVTIDGVTENTQVDITPSVEQLVIFYEKDLTFVTENDDGVVTVYAIGQKPENDYTIQVTMTEVNIGKEKS